MSNQAIGNSEIGISSMFNYIQEGFRLALTPECRLYVIIPILINIVVLSAGGYLLFTVIYSFLESYVNALPEFLSALAYLIQLILFLSIGFVFVYIFSMVAIIIASPFYGLLAEKAESLIRGENALNGDEGFAAIIKDVPRILKRELQKLGFYLPRLLVCVVIPFIPVVNLLAPFAWFLLAAWMIGIQYVDYSYDNHKIPFKQMRQELSHQRLATFTFGALISLGMSIPVLNLLLPPAAVCAGARYYVEMQKRFSIDSVMR